MIKHINHQNLLTTPFVAIKTWELNNRDPDDLVLLETYSASVSTYNPPEEFVAYEYVDFYSGSTPTLNRTCNIALEQQERDWVIYQEGITGSGYFDPANEPQNPDGTYKRLIHSQMDQAFYNTYKNPLKIFGVENFDFPLSRTERQITDAIRIFNIPQRIWGDSIIPRSVVIFDNLLDDNVDIYDDGYQNLLAGTNLFSKIQEVRTFGNVILSGSITNSCPLYSSGSSSVTQSEFVSNSYFESGSQIAVTFYQGTVEDSYVEDVMALFHTFYSGVIFNSMITSSAAESGSVNMLFYTGSLMNQIVPFGNNKDTSSINVLFYTGSLFEEDIPVSGSDNQEIVISYYTGSITTVAIPSSNNEYQTMSISFLNGTRSIVAGGTGSATGSDGLVHPEF